MIQPEIEKLKIKHLMMIIIIMNAMTWHAMGVWQIRGQLVLRCRSLGYMLTFLYKSKNKWKIINFMHTSNCTTSYHPYYLRIEEVVCLQKEKKIPKKKKEEKRSHVCGKNDIVFDNFYFLQTISHTHNHIVFNDAWLVITFIYLSTYIELDYYHGQWLIYWLSNIAESYYWLPTLKFWFILWQEYLASETEKQ